VRETTVLIKDRGMRPLLEFAETADETARAVFAFVAVDQDGVVASVEEDRERCTDLVVWDYWKEECDG
jgi:hypothetical protein